MTTIQPELARHLGQTFEPFAVSPRQACLLLGIGNTRLYQLIGNGELETYLDGRSRRITMESIRCRITQLLAAAGATCATSPHPRKRGRPPKIPAESHSLPLRKIA
jgi:excisionase family DNA binding protein